jgi:hypothetical protein
MPNQNLKGEFTMSAHLKEEETLKRLHDLYRDAPWLGHVVANSVLDIARIGEKIGITKDEVTAELLASINSADDLEELAVAGSIGPNKKFPKKRRI